MGINGQAERGRASTVQALGSICEPFRRNYVAYLVMLPFCLELIFRSPLGSSWPRLTLIASAGVTVLVLIVSLFHWWQEEKKLASPLTLSIYCLLLISVAGLLIHDQGSAVGRFSAVLVAAVVMLALKDPTRSQVDKAIQALGLSLAGAICCSVLFAISGLAETTKAFPMRSLIWEALGIDITRQSGLFPGPGALGFAAALVAFIGAAWPQRLGWLLVSIGLLGMTLAESRAALIACFIATIAGLAATLFSRGRLRFDLSRAFTLIVFCVGLLISMGPERIFGGLGARLMVWRISLDGPAGVVFGEVIEWMSDAGRPNVLNFEAAVGNLPASEWALNTHPHNFVLASSQSGAFYLSVVITVLLLVIFGVGRAMFSGPVIAVGLCLLPITFSMLDFGLDMARMTIATVSLLLGCALFGKEEVPSR